MKRSSIRLQLEQLENRLVPAAFIVTTGDDNGNNAMPTAGSLRAAILAIDAGKNDGIVFNIGAGNQIVKVVTNPLPSITKPVVINGSTQAGQTIQIQAWNKGAAQGNGLVFATGSSCSEILGLSITGFTGNGAQKGKGIFLDNVDNVLIGVEYGAGGNNTYAPVACYGNRIGLEINGANAADNTVVDSFFGTNTAQNATANTTAGIMIDNNAHNNTIGGLTANETNVISGNAGNGLGYGLAIIDANDNTIAGNMIGTTKKGLNALPNNIGVLISGQSSGNQVGDRIRPVKGAQPNPANLISGNKLTGLMISGQTATNNVVVGNWIGVDSTGNTALPNAIGVGLSQTQGNWIGAPNINNVLLGYLNVISGNTLDGIAVTGAAGAASTKNILVNNNIGIGPNLGNPVPVPNGGNGISFDQNSNGNTVRGNAIANNKLKGVLDDGKNKVFDPNSIHDNALGIDDGTQAGAPVLTSAVVSGSTLIVSGTLNNTPSTNFGLEFFGGNDLDPSGSAEGQQWLGTAYVTTDSSGNASFQVTLNSTYGTYITATATDTSADGGTSDFSNTLTISGESQTASVGGNVWDDANADGLPDDGETGVSNVNVQLFTALGSLVASTSADANGNYNFSNLTPGNYYLQFTSPAGYFFTQPYQGDSTIASHADPSTGDTEQFSLIAGEVDPYYNAGLIPDTLQEPTTTALATTENPSYSGQQVTFTATVTQTDCVPLGGTVTFMDGSTTLGTVALAYDSGGYQASFTTSTLAVGQHTITANYNGDGFHTSSSASLTQTVEQAPTTTSVISSNNPSLPEQPVTFTASVYGAYATPTGTVTFYDGSTEIGNATLDDNGNATLTTSSLAAGSHAITADYSGDDNYTSSSGSLTQVISGENDSSVSLSSSANPATLNQSVTFTATVSGTSGTPTGSVTFMDGDTVLGTATLDDTGNATFTTSALSLGSQTITAIYGGDATYGDSSASLTQTANQDATTTALSSDTNPAQAGQAVTFTVTVAPSGWPGATPTGSVTFYDGTTTLGTANLDDTGSATFSTSALAVGSHNITVVYSGDDTYASSAATLTQTVNQPANSSMMLSSSTNPAQPGETVTFTANVFGNGSGTPTGSVTFYDGTTPLGTTSLDDNGNATFSTSSLAVGSHDILAVYNGDASLSGSSASLTQSVSLAQTSSLMMSSDNPVQPGDDVTFTDQVVGDGGSSTPTGTVTFLNGTSVLGTVGLDSNGYAALTTSFTTGIYAITAVYGGDADDAGSSAELTETVGSPSTITSGTMVSSSAYSSVPGQSVTFTAALSGGNGTPTGSVTFLDGTTTLGTASVDGTGNASFTTSSLGLGSNNIVAVYSGDSNYGGSSASIVQTVSQAAPSVTLSGSFAAGENVTFTATVSGSNGTPTGSVTFYNGTTALGTATLDGSGDASLNTSLAAGMYDILAVYSGDTTYSAGSSSLNQTVSMAGSQTAVSSSGSPSLPGQSVTFTASVSGMYGTPTGTVTFLDGTSVLGTATLNGSGVATFTTSSLDLGSNDITAIYSGDSVYGSSTATLTQAVVQAGSSTSLSSSANPSPSGQAVTFTATVAASDPNDGTPTGSVTFFDGTSPLGSGALTLVNGQLQATFTTSAMGLGTHNILALYSGDSTFAENESSMEETISS